MTTTNDAPDTPADSKTEVNENPGEKTLGFSSMNEPATEPTEPKADAKAETDKAHKANVSDFFIRILLLGRI